MAGCVVHLQAPMHRASRSSSLVPCKRNRIVKCNFSVQRCVPALRVTRTARFRASIVSSSGQDDAVSVATDSSAMRDDEESVDPLERLPGTQMGPSIEGPNVNLLYGPYMDHFWVALKEKIQNLRLMELSPEYRVQKGAKARVHNWLLSGDRVRRVRFTYFDGGAAGQAFNSLLYPDTRYDLPLLGIDLLSFGANKILCVIDFQPLSQSPNYLTHHTSILAPVHARIRDKCTRMSSKFFDETQFFSKYLVFYRSNLGAREPTLQVPSGGLWDVYLEYVEIYLRALNGAEGCEGEERREWVMERQGAYDQYNAERDPAIKLFNTYFGVEWSSRFTKDFLFPGATLQDDSLIPGTLITGCDGPLYKVRNAPSNVTTVFPNP